MSRVVFQIGYVKTQKRTQIIKAFINDIECSWDDKSGQFLTTHKDRQMKSTIWYLYEVDLQPDDILQISVSTFLTGIGKDHELTFDSLYYCDEDAPVRTIDASQVGMRGYPLLKGRILELSSISSDDERKQQIEDFLNKDF